MEYKYNLQDLLKAFACQTPIPGEDLDPAIETVLTTITKNFMDYTKLEYNEKNVMYVLSSFFALLTMGIRFGEITRKNYINIMLEVKNGKD
jgi:hypothetical protein